MKPTDLLQWLVRLVTPENGIILDPFMGSGSTGKAAMLEGFRFVGIDMTPEYIEIARARIKHAAVMTAVADAPKFNAGSLERLAALTAGTTAELPREEEGTAE